MNIELTANDVLAIRNALNEVCHGPDAIPDREFQLRMGVDLESAKATLSRIAAACGEVR